MPSNVTPVSTFTAPVTQLINGDPVDQSVTDPTVQALTNRTEWLNNNKITVNPVGSGTSPGIFSTGGSTNGPGVSGQGGGTNGVGLLGTGGTGGAGVSGIGGGPAVGVVGSSGTGYGVVGEGGTGSPGIKSFSGSGATASLETDGPILVGGTTPAHGTAPVPNQIYRGLIPISVGTVTTNGSGGFTSAVGFNFTATISGNDIVIAFPTAPAGSNIVVMTNTNLAACFSEQDGGASSSGFDIAVWNNGAGKVNLGTTAGVVSFVAWAF